MLTIKTIAKTVIFPSLALNFLKYVCWSSHRFRFNRSPVCDWNLRYCNSLMGFEFQNIGKGMNLNSERGANISSVFLK